MRQKWRRYLISQNLITLEDIAIYFGRYYQTIAKIISKLPNFPKTVTVDQQNSRPRYIAGEVVRWGRINAKRIS